MLFRLGFLANGEAWGRGRGGGEETPLYNFKANKITHDNALIISNL